MSLKRKLAAAAIATGGFVTLIAPPASASALYTSLSVTVTLTQCPLGGISVSRVNVSIADPGSAGSSTGDTVGGLRAFSGNALVQGTNFCRTGTRWWESGVGYYNTWQVFRYFSRNGQRTYV